MGNNARGQWEIASDAEDPAYVAGNWYMMQDGVVSAGSALAASLFRLAPFRLRQLANIAQIGGRITTLAASGNIQFAIYAANGNTYLPTGVPVLRTGNIPTDAAGLVAAAPVNGPTQLPRGIYWFGVNADAAAATVAIMQVLSNTSYGSTLTGTQAQATLSTSATANSWVRGYNIATFGTWPDLTGVTGTGEGASNAWALGQFQVQP